MRADQDHTVSLYSGQGTVLRIVGQLHGASDGSGTDPLAVWNWIINVGAAAADPWAQGADPDGVMLHGNAAAVQPGAATVYAMPGPVELRSEGRRVIEPGEQVWLRMRAFSGGWQWMWVWGVRVLVLLPEA